MIKEPVLDKHLLVEIVRKRTNIIKFKIPKTLSNLAGVVKDNNVILARILGIENEMYYKNRTSIIISMLNNLSFVLIIAKIAKICVTGNRS